MTAKLHRRIFGLLIIFVGYAGIVSQQATPTSTNISESPSTTEEATANFTEQVTPTSSDNSEWPLTTEEATAIFTQQATPTSSDTSESPLTTEEGKATFTQQATPTSTDNSESPLATEEGKATFTQQATPTSSVNSESPLTTEEGKAIFTQQATPTSSDNSESPLMTEEGKATFTQQATPTSSDTSESPSTSEEAAATFAEQATPTSTDTSESPSSTEEAKATVTQQTVATSTDTIDQTTTVAVQRTSSSANTQADTMASSSIGEQATTTIAQLATPTSADNSESPLTTEEGKATFTHQATPTSSDNSESPSTTEQGKATFTQQATPTSSDTSESPSTTEEAATTFAQQATPTSTDTSESPSSTEEAKATVTQQTVATSTDTIDQTTTVAVQRTSSSANTQADIMASSSISEQATTTIAQQETPTSTDIIDQTTTVAIHRTTIAGNTQTDSNTTASRNEQATATVAQQSTPTSTDNIDQTTTVAIQLTTTAANMQTDIKATSSISAQPEKLTTILLATTTTATTTTTKAPVTREALFSYGYSYGDWGMYGDDNVRRIYYSRGFPVGSARDYNIYISTNGYINFDRYYNVYAPRVFPTGNVKIVAPFWADSTTYYYYHNYYYYYYSYYYYNLRYRSRVYYGIYLDGKNLYGANATDVFDRVNRLISSKKNVAKFEARAILIVTWYKVLPHFRSETNTFQCVLATDYIRSFAIYLYEDGGMLWPDRSYSLTPVIGYQMGPTQFYNLPYSKKLQAMRIDQKKGNTGVPGMWVFQLDNNRGVKVSYAGKCLDWYTEQKKSNELSYMQAIDRRISDCPCTIWQAFFDRRFRFDWREYSYIEGNYCFYSTISPWRWTGSRKCCYQRHRIRWFWSWWGYGYWGWRYTYILNTDPVKGGGLLRYNPRSLKQRTRYKLHDKEPYVNCCILSGLCSLYREFRWMSDCSRYRAPRRSRFWGDPHITTLDGKGYTFNGWGEYVLLEVKDASTNDLQLMIQGRTDRATNDKDQYTDATIFSAFAAKDHETNATMHVELTDDKKDQTVYCNNVDYTTRFQDRTTEFNVEDENLGCSRPENNTLTVTFQSGISMNVSVGIEMLEISLSVPDELRDNVTTRGLMGAFNSDKDDDFTMPNGTVLFINATEKEIFHDFGKLWSIDESVFHYRLGDNASRHRHENFVPKFLSDYPQHLVDEAKELCGDNNECIFDYLSTNRTDVAASTLNTANETANEDSVIGNAIPTLSAESTIQVTLGETTYLTIEATDADNDNVTIYLVNNITGDSNLTQTGNTARLEWTPDSLDPTVLSIAGSDDGGGEAAPILLTVLICRGCSGHGTCDFNSTGVDIEQTNSNSSSFTVVPCDCDDGWIGDNCEEDFDGCADGPCPSGSNCTDLLPGEQESLNGTAFRCDGCPGGQELADNKCVDVDECNATDSVCDQICFNTDGSYSCACNDGYYQEGVSTCIDMDECAEDIDDCDHICANTDGGYNCSCEAGFLSNNNGTTCQKDPDHDPCPGSGLNCSYACRKGNNNSADCFCQSGYQLTNNIECVDVDECLSGKCTQECINTEGSYTCGCYSGNKLQADKRTCEKCDSLHWGDDCSTDCDCSEDSVECHNVRGCVCASGWEGTVCDIDLDECVTEECESLKECVNSPGSYECVCMDGYKEESGVCVDIDECEEDSHNCTFDCVNGLGSYICECSAGYTGDGVTCEDVDECTSQVPDCEHTCVNTEGGYNCDCYTGFKLNNDRSTCVDVDNLCSNFNETCDHICSVNDTTIQCYCRPGYDLINNTICQDINECVLTDVPCSQQCTNSNGGYQCTCHDGYQLSNDKRTCDVCDEFHWGPNCTNECLCGQGMDTCNSTLGCVCKSGWQGDKCDTDIRECEMVSKCAQDKICVELLGSYRCDCPDGKEKNGSSNCVDIDECSTSTHTCAQDCANTDGSYSCRCKPGFRDTNGDGRVCDDINECEAGHLCQEKCTNIEGAYTCVCYPGNKLDTNKLDCINDPTTEACAGLGLSCSHGCKVENGQGICYCNRDYVLQSDGKTCKAIRRRVKAKITLQLMFNSSLTVTTSEYYKQIKYMIQEALWNIYNHLPFCSSVLILEFRKGSVESVHEVVFNGSVSSPQTVGVADALKNSYSSGGLDTSDGNVGITESPAIINDQDNAYSVTDAYTCAMSPCGYEEDCQDTNNGVQCGTFTTTTAPPTTTTRGLTRYHVEAIVHLELTFTEKLSDTSSSEYSTMASNLTQPVTEIYNGINYFSDVQILQLSNGSIAVDHNAVFSKAVSSAITIAVARILNDTYNQGYLTVNGVNVTITQVPVIVALDGSYYLVSLPLTCTATPCGYNEDCSDENGIVVCTPKSTSGSSNSLALGLGIGLSLLLLLIIGVIIAVIVKKKKTTARRRFSRVSDISINAGMRQSFVKKDEFGSAASKLSSATTSSQHIGHPPGAHMWDDIPEVDNRAKSWTSFENRPSSVENRPTSPNIGPLIIVSEAENPSLFVEPDDGLSSNLFASYLVTSGNRKKKGASRTSKPF